MFCCIGKVSTTITSRNTKLSQHAPEMEYGRGPPGFILATQNFYINFLMSQWSILHDGTVKNSIHPCAHSTTACPQSTSRMGSEQNALNNVFLRLNYYQSQQTFLMTLMFDPPLRETLSEICIMAWLIYIICFQIMCHGGELK